MECEEDGAQGEGYGAEAGPGIHDFILAGTASKKY